MDRDTVTEILKNSKLSDTQLKFYKAMAVPTLVYAFRVILDRVNITLVSERPYYGRQDTKCIIKRRLNNTSVAL